MDKDIRNVKDNGNKQLMPSQSRTSSSGRISPFEGTSLQKQRTSQLTTPRPEFPPLPELPEIPTFDFSSYDRWIKEWEENIRKWEMDVERYQVDSKKWYDENYDTTNYIDEDGFSVYESVSKDGRSRIVMKTKFDHNNGYYSKTTIWKDGKKVFDNESERTVISTSTDSFSESRTIVTPRSTSTTYTASTRRKRARRRKNRGCCGCLILMLIAIAIIVLAIIGLSSLL